MKKWFAVCLGAFISFGCATTQMEDFKIDAAATAQAPWEVGEVFSDAKCPLKLGAKCTRVFLGVTDQGHKVLQEFYSDGKKATDPYLIISDVSWEEVAQLDNLPSSRNAVDIVEGRLRAWYPSGAKYVEFVKNKSGNIQWTEWYESGGKKREMELKDGAGYIKEWDEKGNVTREQRTDKSE